MYEEYYGFVQPPFSLTPDPRFLYRSESHDVALQQVWQGIRRKEGFLVLTGDIGTGKTTMCRTLLEQFDETTFTALILNPFLSVEELLGEVLISFGVVSRDALKRGQLAMASKHELIRTLHDFLLSLVTLHGSAVLIIDEAQHLTPEVLEEIRVISNLETNDQKLLQIVIVGQLNLLEMLARADLRQLNQRISIRCSLKALTREEVEAYVTHRLWVARGSTSVNFTPKALDLVQVLSGGVPRIINLVCDRSLMVGCEAKTSKITEDHIVQAARHLGLEIQRGKIRGERTTTAPARSRRAMAWAAVLLLAASLGGAVWAVVGNPLEFFADRPLPTVRRATPPPLHPVAAALPVPVDPFIDPPPQVPGTFSILVGTYDSVKQVAITDAVLRTQDLPLYTIDVMMAPGDMQRRILIGRYDTRAAAESASLKVKPLVAEARVIPGAFERFRVIP